MKAHEHASLCSNGFGIRTLFRELCDGQRPTAIGEARLQGFNGKTLLYQLLKPEKVDASKKYPLVVFLHGAGERGNDNEAQLVHGVPQFASKENREKYPCFLIAPQCPISAEMGGGQLERRIRTRFPKTYRSRDA